MQGIPVDCAILRQICDEFRVTGSLVSKDGKKGFPARVMIDFLTCEKGFSAELGKKYADSRDHAKSIGKMLVKNDLIHHHRDADDFRDDDAFFRFLDDEPAPYFQSRTTVLSLLSPIRTVRPGRLLWSCEDILLGNDLEVWNCAVVVLYQVNSVTTLYAYREFYDRRPKFQVIVRDSVQLSRLNDASSQQIAIAIKSNLQDGESFVYSLLFHQHWSALSFASFMIECGATYSVESEEHTAEAACAAIAAHLSFNDFSDTLDSALQLIEETEKPYAMESQNIASTSEIQFLQRVLTPENFLRMKYFSNINFCKTLCSQFFEAEMDPKKKIYWQNANTLFIQILNVESTLAPFSEAFGSLEAPVKSTEQVRELLHSSLSSVLKSLETSIDPMNPDEIDDTLPPFASAESGSNAASTAVELVSRTDCIEMYWQSLAILCEQPGWPPHKEFVRFDLILHRYTTRFVFSKSWVRHFYACRGNKLYYQIGSADSKEGLERFIASNPADDFKHCVPLTGCTVEPLENQGSYFPFVITLPLRSRDKEPFKVYLAADDERTRKQSMAVIKVASQLARTDEDSSKKLSITTRLALQSQLLCMRNQAALDGVLRALQKPSVDIDDYILLKNAGFSLDALKTAGFDAVQLRAAGFSVRALRQGGFSFKELKSSGCTAASLYAAGFAAKDLKEAELTLQEIKAAGVDLLKFKNLGYDLAALQNAGFDHGILTVAFFDGRFDPGALKEANFGALQLKSAGFDAKLLKDVGFELSSLIPAYDVFSLLSAGFQSPEIAKIKPTFVITREAQKIRASLSRNELPSFVLSELFGENKQSYLLYDSFTDGDTPQSFHRCCDLKGPNLVVVSSRAGFVIGAYTSASWDSRGGSFPSPGAFVVPLINHQSIPWSTKYYLKDQEDQMVIICDDCQGPRFYGTLDIRGGFDPKNVKSNSTPVSNFDETSKIAFGHDICPFEGSPDVNCKSFIQDYYKVKMEEYGGTSIQFLPHRVQVFSITNLGESLIKIAAAAVIEREKERLRSGQLAFSLPAEIDEPSLNSLDSEMNAFFLRHVKSGMYVLPKLSSAAGGFELVLGMDLVASSCRFLLLADRSIQHMESGLFIHSALGIAMNGAGLMLCAERPEPPLAFDFDAGCLLHRDSGLFVHPKGGRGSEGVELILLPKGPASDSAEEIEFKLEIIEALGDAPVAGGTSAMASSSNVRQVDDQASDEAQAHAAGTGDAATSDTAQ